MAMMIRSFTASLAMCLVLAGVAPAQSVTSPGQPAATTIKPGQIRLVASYFNASGRLVSDTVIFTVTPVPIATIDIFNAFNPPRWIATTSVGRTFCAFAQAKDSSGNVITGRPIVWGTSDTTVLKVGTSTICPDTTVDASKLTVNPLPP